MEPFPPEIIELFVEHLACVVRTSELVELRRVSKQWSDLVNRSSFREFELNRDSLYRLQPLLDAELEPLKLVQRVAIDMAGIKDESIQKADIDLINRYLTEMSALKSLYLRLTRKKISMKSTYPVIFLPHSLVELQVVWTSWEFPLPDMISLTSVENALNDGIEALSITVSTFSIL
jgi:hypothetical protein